MLRIRSIHYNAFRSQKLAALSAEGERCWWRLQCLCDDDGRAEDDPDVICGFVFPKRRDFTPDQVDGWLQELHDIGLIVRYEVAGERYLSVNQWHDYQHPRRPQSSKIPPCPEPSYFVATSPDEDGRTTSPDTSRHVAQEGRGEERKLGEEGESEGETEPTLPDAPAVDNPRVLSWVERAELRALEASRHLAVVPNHNHAAGAMSHPVHVSAPLTNGEAG